MLPDQIFKKAFYCLMPLLSVVFSCFPSCQRFMCHQISVRIMTMPALRVHPQSVCSTMSCGAAGGGGALFSTWLKMPGGVKKYKEEREKEMRGAGGVWGGTFSHSALRCGTLHTVLLWYPEKHVAASCKGSFQ